MQATASRISKQAGYKAELNKLKSIKNEIKNIKQTSLPEKEREIEHLKRSSIEEDGTTWQDVEEAQKELDRLHYKLQYLESQATDQEKVVSKEKEKAREVINKSARERKLEALEKSVAGFEMVMAAYEEYHAINQEQLKALELSAGERHSARTTISDIGQRVPHPFREGVNDVWYKQAKEYLKKVK